MVVTGDGAMMDPQTDAIWILSSTFIVFTMQSAGERFACKTTCQSCENVGKHISVTCILIGGPKTGFGLLESGSVSVKNELNIMVKNAVDVVFGGLMYWMFGYGLSFGNTEYSNAIVGWGDFFVDADENNLGVVYSKFFFQASFATTATTIVSGAMAERTKLTSYMVFSMFNTILFCIPAHWIWASNGWLYRFGVVDIAGAGPVHVVGGVTGLIATLMLKPRHGRYETHGNSSRTPQMSSPTNAVLGMFMLWWGWLGFNCGSTFGISGLKWKLAARSAATTLCSSVAGGVAAFMLSYIVKDRKFDVTYLINGVLGSLVSVTAVCAIVQPWEGLVIGFVGSIISNAGVALLDKLRIDDPVGCVGTHALSGSWGMLVAGLFIKKDTLLDALYLQGVTGGLFYGGGFRQLGVQTLAVVSITCWTVIMSFIILKCIDLTLGLRVPLEEEIIGADIVEHGIGDLVYDRRTGTVTQPPGADENDTIAPINEHLGSVRRRRCGSNVQSCPGTSHILGLTRRRRTLDEICFDLSKEARHASAKCDLTPHVEEWSETSVQRVDVNDQDSCQKLSSVIPTEPISTHRSFLSRLRNSVFPKSVKTEHGSADQVNISHIMNTEDSNTGVCDPRRHRTQSLQLQNYKLHQILRDKSSMDSVTSADGSAHNGYGPCRVHQSSDTLTFELCNEDNGSESHEFHSNRIPLSYEITHL